jgi:hypothetical protein
VLRILTALACLAAAVTFAVQWRDDRTCTDAREQVFATRGEDATAIATVRETCRGTLALLNVAGALRYAGRQDQALELAREAAEAEPGNAGAWRAVAALSDGAERASALRRLERLDPRSLKRSAGRSTR